MPDNIQITEELLDALIGMAEREREAKVPEERGYLSTFGAGLRRGVVGLPEAAGAALKFLDRPGGLPLGEWGEDLTKITRGHRFAHPEQERAQQLAELPEWSLKRMVAAGGEMIPMSVGAIVAGAPVAAGVVAAVPTAPIWVPTLAAATTGGALFGLSEAGQTLELSRQELTKQAIEAGEDPQVPEVAQRIEQTSRKASNRTGLIEFLGESASNIPIFAWMKIGKPAFKTALKNVLKAPSWRGFLKNMGIVFGAEVSTEEGQVILQNLTLKKHGVLPDQVWHEGTGEAFGATMILSAFLSGGAHTMSEAQRRSTVKRLENPNTSPEQRMRAAQNVAAQMKAVDPELSEAWFEQAKEAITNKVALSTKLENYVKPIEQIKKETKAKAPEPLTGTGEATAEIAKEQTPKETPLPLEEFPGEVPEIFGEPPSPQPLTSGLAEDELMTAVAEIIQPEMGEAPFMEKPIFAPHVIAEAAEKLLATPGIELPGFTERGFTLGQETEMAALNNEEAKLQRRLNNLESVSVKTKKIRQKIIDAESRTGEIQGRRAEIQIERLGMLMEAVQARKAEAMPPEPEAALPVAEEAIPAVAPIEEAPGIAEAPVMEAVPEEAVLPAAEELPGVIPEAAAVPEVAPTPEEALPEKIVAPVKPKKKPEKPVTKPKAKEPWEMTLPEWEKQQAKEFVMESPKTSHRRFVEIAIKGNKPVPKEVLAEYPELKAKGKEKARKLKPAEAYLSEEITVGGEKTTRGRLIKDLEKQGVARKDIDAYLMGLERGEKVRKPKPEEIKVTGPAKEKEVKVDIPKKEAETLKPAEQKAPRQVFRMTEAVEVTNTQGKAVTLPKGEEYTAYDIGEGKIRLQDGKQVTIYEGELSKLKGQMLPPGEQPMAGGMMEAPFLGKPKAPEPPPAPPTTPEEAEAVIKEYHGDYISAKPTKQRPSLIEAAHSLYQRMVDRIHGVVRKEKAAQKGLQAGDFLELTDEQYEALSPQNKRYYDYIKKHQVLPPGMTPETVISNVYAASAIANSYISPMRGVKEDAIIFTDMEGNQKQLYDKTLETIIKDRNQVDIEAYMIAERDIELSGQLSVYGKKIVGTHPERSRQVMDAVKVKYGDKFNEEIQKTINEIREWQDAVFLRQLVEVGALSEERYKAIKKRGQKYVTFWRVMDEVEEHGHVRPDTNLFRPGRIPIKVIKGQESQIISPFESMIVMAHRATQFAQAARFASSVAKLRLTTPAMAELFQRRDPKWIPHKVELKEELDPQMMDQLADIAKSLNTSITTLQTLGGKKLGEFRAYLNNLGVLKQGEIYRRFATSERTVSHELGHAIDERYDLKEVLMANPEMKRELRKVADQRVPEEASDYYKKYVRKREEQVAEFVNRYINSREQARELAPTVTKAFETFCSKHKELKPILDIDLSGQVNLVPFEATIFTRSPFAPEKDTIMTLEDGKPTYFKVPHDVFVSMENFNNKEMGFLVKVIGAPARLLRAGATMTFEFALGRNPIRDVMSAWVYGHRSGFGFRHWAKGFASVLKQDKHFRDWTAGGGPISAFVSEDRPQLAITIDELTGKKSKAIKYVKNPLEALRLLSVTLENTTRVGIYRAGIEKGLTHAEAIKESRIGTLDFLRWGYNARVLNQIIAFWNANVQGVDKMIRETTTEKERAHTWLRIAKGIIAPTVILWAINKDDERYKELPSWRKLLCWNIICGKDGPIFSLPKPWIAVGVITEGFLNYLYEKDPKALEATWESLLEGIGPGYLPTALVPFIESEADFNFFLQRPIEGPALKNLPASQRYRAWTPEIAKEVGKIFDVSPVKFENWVRSWAGGMGMYAMQLADYPLAAVGVKPKVKLKEPVLKRIPVIKGLVAREPIGSAGESVNRFYENLVEIVQAEQGLKDLQTKRDLEGYRKFRSGHPEYKFAKRARKTEKRLSELRLRKRIIYEADVADEIKRKKIKSLDQRMTDIAKAFNEGYNVKLKSMREGRKNLLE